MDARAINPRTMDPHIDRRPHAATAEFRENDAGPDFRAAIATNRRLRLGKF
jgi:hypothetical protein